MTMPGTRRTFAVFAAIALLIILCIPIVSADTIVDEELTFYEDTGGTYTNSGSSAGEDGNMDNLIFRHIENYPDLSYVAFTISGVTQVPNDGSYEFTYTGLGETKTGRYHVERIKNLLGTVTGYRYIVFFDDWDIGSSTGGKSIVISKPFFRDTYWKSTNSNGVIDIGNGGRCCQRGYTITVAATKIFKNHLSVNDDYANSYQINLKRVYDTKAYASTISLMKDDNVVLSEGSADDFTTIYLKSEINNIKVVSGDEVFNIPLISSNDSSPVTVLRTGTVTMTDNNGTTITGFEVTAVNAYTDQSYTVVTESDVAVMTLPMERTIQIRNPQTGEYEEAPIGYYRFYGQSSGYKMLVEDGIQVSVMPEKYGSYQLCDIGVTSESGYLTGKHQFQIRSRSDNSILQTGTINAKSATTGEWYNTTVSGGLASLILPYDTSNTQSRYAGNYYVYATSPGYEDSDYATQIVVMPHTVSETRDILLTPTGGIPTPGNVTLRIQAFSETGSAVVNAEIFVSGVQGAGASLWDTYTASSTGYLTVPVPGNSTYDIVARGAGYYDSARRVEVFTEDPPLIEIKLYLSGAPTLEPTTQPTGWPTDHPTTQPTGGIPDEDDDSEGFLIQAVRGIGLTFGVGFATAKLIFGMLLALSIGYATAKQLRGGAAEFGLGLLGGTLLGVLIGLLPVWIIVVLLLIVGLYIGNRYVGGGNHG